MNLTNLFNFKYMKQNLKKSKGMIILLTIIVPIITILSFILINNSYGITVLKEPEIAMVNIIGMAVIPIVLSTTLLGYIYKKNSIDFINSMPLNRKTIFLTNYITGLGIILIIQILTGMTYLISGAIFSNIVILPQMIFDIFITMTISYIFLFSISMLAMTISGNKWTQMVLILLIIYLFPSITFLLGNIVESPDLIIYKDNIKKVANEIKISELTMPARFLSRNFTEFYSVKANIKMLILSVIYLILGIYLFDKRKMENTGTSFASEKTHIIVKGLTIIPMILFVLFLIETTLASKIALIGIIFIYYIIYDFITGKKVKFRYTILSYVLTVIILFVAFKGIIYVKENKISPKVTIDDIIGIGINIAGRSSDLKNEEYNNFVEDREIIEEIFDCIANKEENLEELVNYSNIIVKFKFKNGKTKYLRIMANDVKYHEIRGKIVNAEEYKKNHEEMTKGENSIFVHKGIKLSSSESRKIEEILEKNNQIIEYGDYLDYIDEYYYKNHRLKNKEIPITINQELFDLITKLSNEKTVEKLKTLPKTEYRIEAVIVKESSKIYLASISSLDEKFIKYAEKNAAQSIKKDNTYYMIEINTEKKRYLLYLEKNDEISQILAEMFNKGEIYSKYSTEILNKYEEDLQRDSAITKEG